MQAARDNIKDPPGIFVKVGLESLRGTLRFINDDLPRAFSRLDDMHILGDLADASTEAAARDRAATSSISRRRSRPKTKGSFRLGQREVRTEAAARRRASTLGAERLLDLAMRELRDDAGGVPARRRRA